MKCEKIWIRNNVIAGSTPLKVAKKVKKQSRRIMERLQFRILSTLQLHLRSHQFTDRPRVRRIVFYLAVPGSLFENGQHG
jgi:hypothetical protein